MTEIVILISRIDRLAGEQDCRHNSRLRNPTMISRSNRHHQKTRHHHQAIEEEVDEEEVDEEEVGEEEVGEEEEEDGVAMTPTSCDAN